MCAEKCLGANHVNFAFRTALVRLFLLVTIPIGISANDAQSARVCVIIRRAALIHRE